MSLLSEHDVGPFLARRLAQAALPADLLTDDAIARLAERSGGVPRVLNALTGAALFFAHREQSARIEVRHVDQAASLRDTDIDPPDVTKVEHNCRAWPTSTAAFSKGGVLCAGACAAAATIGVVFWQAPAHLHSPPAAPAMAPIPAFVQVAGSALWPAAAVAPSTQTELSSAADSAGHGALPPLDPAPGAIAPEAQAAAAVRAVPLLAPGASAHAHDVAEPHDPQAQFDLGMLYDLGKDMPRDALRAYFWYLRAAESGLAAAEFNVAVMRDNGDGVPRDATAAALWYALAAAQGNHRAQYNLGLLYAAGDGVPRDLGQAEAYFRAAAAELPAAAARLAEMRRSPH